MSQLPAHLQKYQTRDIGTTLSANLGSAMPPHVSIAGGRFTLVDASNNELPGAWFDQKLGVYIDACIIDANDHLSRTYFAGAYNPDAEGVRPDCFSDNGIGPSVSASSPQARSCTPDPEGVFGCKWAVWGSHINQNGKRVPKCAEKQKIALLIPGFDMVFLLAVPPKSGNHLRAYTELCKGNNINMADVLTRIYFLAGAVGELQFKGVSYIDEPMAIMRQAAWDEKKTDGIVGRLDTPRAAGSIAPPVQQPLITAQGPAQQPVQQPFQQPQQPAQQVQQPGPFGTNPAQNAAQTGQQVSTTAPPAGTSSPFEPQVQQSGHFPGAGAAGSPTSTVTPPVPGYCWACTDRR